MDGRFLNPNLTVTRDGTLHPTIIEVVETRTPYMREWDIARWLSLPHLGLGGHSPRDHLASGRDPDHVLIFATLTARRCRRERSSRHD